MKAGDMVKRKGCCGAELARRVHSINAAGLWLEPKMAGHYTCVESKLYEVVKEGGDE